MYAPLEPVRVEERKKGRVRLHLIGRVKIADIMEVVQARAGWISPAGGWVDIYPCRPKRKRESVGEPVNKVCNLGPYHTQPSVKKVGLELEISGVEKFRMEQARGILGFTCDFSRGLLYKPPPKELRTRLLVAKRASDPKNSPPPREFDR